MSQTIVKVAASLSRRQELIAHSLSQKELLEYISSFVYGKFSGALHERIRRLKHTYTCKSNWANGLEMRSNINSTINMRSKGHFVKLNNKKFKANIEHKVASSYLGQWIGVEIECFIPQWLGNDYFDEDNGFDKDRFEDDHCQDLAYKIERLKIPFCNVKTDGSIHSEGDDGEYLEVEINCLTKIEDMSNLKALCELLQKLGAEVNTSCGLHVHLDQRDILNNDKISDRAKTLRVNKRAMSIYHALPVLKSMQPKSRQNNTYCKDHKPTKRLKEKYSAVNMIPVKKFGTIEVRLHSGTTDFTKISNWIKIVYAVSRANIDDFIVGPNHLSMIAELSLDLQSYMNERIEKFKLITKNNGQSEAAA